MIFRINALTVLVMAALGGLSSLLANQSIAVFHDGLRPLLPQYLNKAMDRRSLFATSFALSFGLVIGFGLPTSITGKIIIVHTILLACDIIGTAFNDTKRGMILSAAVGCAYGILLLFGMQAIMNLFAKMPINFTSNLSSVGNLIIISFCVFPAIAVAYQKGVKTAAVVLVLTMLIKHVTSLYGKFTVNGVKVALNADGMALLFGICAMLVVAARVKSDKTGEATKVFSLFEDNIARIRKNVVLLAISGGVVALATTLLLISEGPASLTLTAEGNYTEAAMVSLGRMLGFIPLVMTTAIMSGVYSPAGTKAVHVPALLLINFGIVGLVGSFFIGALIMVIEILLLNVIAKGMDKSPGLKDLGDNTRTAMSKVLDLALLVGGMIAANAIAPTMGYILVIGLYFLNQNSKKPIPTMAVGPVGAICTGILVNILHVIGLFPVAK